MQRRRHTKACGDEINDRPLVSRLECNASMACEESLAYISLSKMGQHNWRLALIDGAMPSVYGLLLAQARLTELAQLQVSDHH